MDNRINILWGFLAGTTVGAIAGLVFAPEKGSVTRQNIVDKSSEFADEVKSAMKSGVDKINSWTQSAFSLVNKYEEESGTGSFKL